MCTPGCDLFGVYVLEPDGELTPLGTLGGFAAVVGAMNERGTIVGQADTPLFEPNGFAVSVAFAGTKATGLHSLGTLPGFVNSQAYGINERGEIVGWSYNTNPVTGAIVPDFRGFVVGLDGVMRDVGSLGGATIARDVSDRGVVVGSSRLADGQTRAFALEHGVMRELASLGGRFAEATGINKSGVIVGSATRPGFPNGQRRAVLWRKDGSIVDLGTLGGPFARAWKINARGDVVGDSVTAAGDVHAFLYRNGVMHDLGTLGGDSSFALGLNSAGNVVGASDTGAVHPEVGPVSHGFVVDLKGVMHDVTTLVATP
jgi:probable HAF family extracellular repeat protein